MVNQERRKEPRFRPVGVTAVVRSPASETPYRFQVHDMSATGLNLGPSRSPVAALNADEVVDVELWGFRQAIRARAVVLRAPQGPGAGGGIGLKLYAFENGDEDVYRGVLTQGMKRN